MQTDSTDNSNKPILVTRSSLPPIEEYFDEIRSIWDTHHLTNMGPKHRAFERELTEYLRAENITLYTNGHLALENMMSAYGLQGEVITTPFTFVSTTNAIIRSGLKPVFCDIKEDDYTIDPKDIERKLSPKTCAILGVHVYGNLCDWRSIDKIAQNHRLKVFYDAAHAFGVEEGGVGVAGLGDCSMFSLHATKVFHSVEGGILCYKDGAMKPILDSYKNFGIDTCGEYAVLGGNAKMSEFHAAMGLCNLRHLDDEIAKRKRVFERYFELLSDENGIRFCVPANNVRHNYAYLPILFDGAYDRDIVFDALKEANIFARKYFYPLASETPAVKAILGNVNKTPVAAEVARKILCLPMYADLSLSVVDEIAKIVLKTKKNR